MQAIVRKYHFYLLTLYQNILKAQSTIEAKFLRDRNLKVHTRIWKDTPEQIKNKIFEVITLDDGESPIICYYPNSGYWWLLTSFKILVFERNEVNVIMLSDIQAVELKKLFDGDVAKQECDAVQLKINGVYIDLKVERRTWPIVFTVIQFIIK